MSLSIGIVGLPNVGKSTLFNALTKNDILAANYPFATIEPNTGIVPVPDERLKKLSEMYHSAPIVPAVIEFVDIAGLVAGASKGEGLGNQFLANIRECDAILHIVRAFENNDIVHVHDAVAPEHDIATINTELALADLQTIEKTLPKIQKEAKADPKLKPEVEALEKAQKLLESGELISNHPEIDIPKSRIQLLTSKPVIYVFNVDESDLQNAEKQTQLIKIVNGSKPTGNTSLDAVQGSGEEHTEAYNGYAEGAPQTANTAMRQNRVTCLFVNAQLEAELKDMSDTEAKEMLQSYGQSESGLNQVVTAAYNTLGLQSYLTAGEKEVRAWTIPKGATAPEAAGVIHGDFERGFIAAEIVSYPDLIAAGSLANARASGKVRTEGKTYVMQPEDVVEFRFNV